MLTVGFVCVMNDKGERLSVKRRMIAVFLLLAILAGMTVSVYAAETTKTATATTTEIKDGWVYV